MSGNYAVGEVWFDHAGNQCSYRENGTIEVITVNNEPSMTIQSEKDSCDVNKIVAKHGLKNRSIRNIASILANTPYFRRDEPQYGDFTGICDYASAMIRTREAGDAFMQLPSALRKRFSNDPAQLVAFLDDENNRAEAIELGLIERPVQQPEPESKSAEGESES